MDNKTKNSVRVISLVCALFIPLLTNAVDLSNRISDRKAIRSWQVLEVAGGNQIGYRLATTSILNPGIHIVFDFLPSNNCISAPAVMIVEYDSYKRELDEGLALMEYKFPKERKGTIEAVTSEMSKGDRFAFIKFQKLTVEKFYSAGNKGKLAIWVPEGREIPRSGNMYFSLDGFVLAYKKAKKSCSDNMSH